MSTDQERAERRARAMARLEETKRRIALSAGSSKPSGSAQGSASATSAPSGSAASGSAASGSAPSASAASGSAGSAAVGSAAAGSAAGGSGGAAPGQSVASRPAATVRDASTKKSGLFSKPYIEYDFSTMKDSRGGYINEEEPQADIHQTWLNKLNTLNPPFPFSDPRAPTCFECGTKELDFRLYYVFKARVCRDCRENKPEKYTLLTKTECKQDYLLTEPELKDTELMPHLERPNPYKNTYSNMMLYLRYQVEEFAFKKWGSPEGLDAEYERRVDMTKVRKKAKFEARLREIRNKTRAQTLTKTGARADKKHVHVWSQPVPQEDGTVERRCGCGMTVNELNF